MSPGALEGMVDVALGDDDDATNVTPMATPSIPPPPAPGTTSVSAASTAYFSDESKKVGMVMTAGGRASEKKDEDGLESRSSSGAAAESTGAGGAAAGYDGAGLDATAAVTKGRDAETPSQRRDESSDGNGDGMGHREGIRDGGAGSAGDGDGDGDGGGGGGGRGNLGASEERDNAPLMSAHHSRHNSSSINGGMIALELSSTGEGVGDDLVLDDDRWRWRHTVSYWVCISFILGSLLFVAGCAFWYKRYVYESRKRALVTYPFLCGSVCFTVGSYLGIFQAINVGRRGSSIFWRWVPEKDGFMGYLYYLIGALVFNVSCAEPLEMFSDWPAWVKREMAWGAAEIGSACFIAGAFVEVRHNRCLDVRACLEDGRWKTLPFWLSWNNLSGGVFFFVAAVAGRWVPESPGWVYTTYLVGSINFFIAASIMLYMWKGEQYGLGFIPSINRVVPLTRAAHSASHSSSSSVGASANNNKGYRRVSVLQFTFVQVYILLTGASFIDFCFATQRFSVYSQYHGFAHFHEVVASLMGVFMAVGLLVMASVLHHTPRIHPFDKLLYWVQVYVAVKLIQILISVGEYYTVALESDEAELHAAEASGGPLVGSGGPMMAASPPPSPPPPPLSEF